LRERNKLWHYAKATVKVAAVGSEFNKNGEVPVFDAAVDAKRNEETMKSLDASDPGDKVIVYVSKVS
jgi:hypothetical protein